jgi:hypothetical protein
MPRISIAFFTKQRAPDADAGFHRMKAHAAARSRGRHTRLRARRIARKAPRTWAAKKTAGENAGPHLANAKCSQHRATGGDVVLHEGLECLTDKMNCLRRLKSEAVGEFFVSREVPGLGLIYESLAETFFQHATPIKLLAQELSSLTTSPVVVTISRNTRSR